MKNLVIFPRGQLAPKDRERMTKAGFLVVEADDPSRVIQLAPTPHMVSAEDFMMSALHAVHHGHEGVKFVDELYRRLKQREQAQESGHD